MEIRSYLSLVYHILFEMDIAVIEIHIGRGKLLRSNKNT